jgi:hypothetical protein
MRATDSHTNVFTTNLLSVATLYDTVSNEIEGVPLGPQACPQM